ncbi:hypothetical protein [Fontibacillus panacisegetis]|uniref:hypothetical protein n=1 Tax=Fontibacillus panacisegetis TaxID=670482 RepID=UPI000B84C897|nr:hypothetical protein [Fontibacillus panacisegetis]
MVTADHERMAAAALVINSSSLSAASVVVNVYTAWLHTLAADDSELDDPAQPRRACASCGT